MSFTQGLDIFIDALSVIETEAICLGLTLKYPGLLKIPVVGSTIKVIIREGVQAQMRAGRSLIFNNFVEDYKKGAAEDAKKAADVYHGATDDKAKKESRQKLIDEARKLVKFTPP